MDEDDALVAPPPLIRTSELSSTTSNHQGDEENLPSTHDEADGNDVEGDLSPIIILEDQVGDTSGAQEILLPAVVTMDRKELLLKQAREDRLAWIQSVPLPFSAPNHNSILDGTHILPELPSITNVLSHLYGTSDIASRVEDLISKNFRDTSGKNDAVRNAQESWEEERQKAAADEDKELSLILADYRALLAQLERPESAVIVNSMRHAQAQLSSAVASASAGGEKDAANGLRNLSAPTLEQLKRLGGDETWTTRSLESFIFGQAQAMLKALLSNEKNRDQEFYEKLQLLDFLTTHNLDLECFDGENNKYLEPAVATLQSVQTFFSPYEKLQRILKTYHCINAALTKAQGGKIPSADDVLPTLIWVVLQTKPQHLISNLAVIETFALPEYLRGEAGYAFTNLYGAVQFLVDLNLTPTEGEPMTSLTMTPEQFRSGLENSRAIMQTQLEALDRRIEPDISAVEPARTVCIPVSQVRAARLQGEVIDLEWARLRFPSSSSEATRSGQNSYEHLALPHGFTRNYTFLTVRPEDVRLKDLPLLMQEYKMLVHTTEVLLAERSERANRERKERLDKAEKINFENAIEAELELSSAGRRK